MFNSCPPPPPSCGDCVCRSWRTRNCLLRWVPASWCQWPRNPARPSRAARVRARPCRHPGNIIHPSNIASSSIHPSILHLSPSVYICLSLIHPGWTEATPPAGRSGWSVLLWRSGSCPSRWASEPTAPTRRDHLSWATPPRWAAAVTPLDLLGSLHVLCWKTQFSIGTNNLNKGQRIWFKALCVNASVASDPIQFVSNYLHLHDDDPKKETHLTSCQSEFISSFMNSVQPN